MLFGHNTNVKVGATAYHVQTEDRGAASALIDTTVYHNGRVMHRRTNNYHDLLPLNADRKEALRLRLNEQHRATLEDVRSNALNLVVPAAPETPVAASAGSQPVRPAENHALSQPAAQSMLKLELCNAHNWLSGKQARLEIAVPAASGESLLLAIHTH